MHPKMSFVPPVPLMPEVWICCRINAIFVWLYFHTKAATVNSNMLMNPGSTRIFLTTSPINCLFYLIYLRQHPVEGVKDILVIDSGGIQTTTTTQFIRELAAQHPWFQLMDFSHALPVGQSISPKASLRKRLTWRLKKAPVFKPVYSALLKVYKNRHDKHYARRIKKQLLENIAPESVSTLFLNTKTHLNSTFTGLFKTAEVIYMEHGMGDYFILEQEKNLPMKFSCLFDEAFRKYLAPARAEIVPFYYAQYFQEAVQNYLTGHRAAVDFRSIPHPTKKNLLVLLQNVEFFGIDPAIQLTFLDSIFTEMGAGDYYFILKPHPRQSAEVIAFIKNYLDAKGVAYYLLDAEELKSINIEIIFAAWQEKITAVFTMFSSALFYLSKLFPSNEIRFFYNYEILRREIDTFTPNFREEYLACAGLIEHVFAENCIEMKS